MNLSQSIRLLGKMSDSLDWSEALSEGDLRSDPIVWQFDLGLESPYFPLEDEMAFQSLSVSLDQFTKEVWPRYADKTRGAILYAGSGDFESTFRWGEKQKENWLVWLEEKAVLPEHLQKKTFCADAYAHYFQMLAHRLPDELPLYLLFDARTCGSLAERHFLFSGDRFDHFELALKGVPHFSGLIWEDGQIQVASRNVQEAFCFPHESRCSRPILSLSDELMQSFSSPFRVIPEISLTEQWDGIDVLYVIQEALTSQGNRKLKGFEAAGGRVEFRGRGI